MKYHIPGGGGPRGYTIGEVRCWGQNNFSQLGLGSSVTVGDNEVPSEVDPVSVF